MKMQGLAGGERWGSIGTSEYWCAEDGLSSMWFGNAGVDRRVAVKT